MEMKLLAITLAVLVLFVSTTSAYRAIIVTVEDDDNQSSPQQCRQQMQRQSLNHCQQYVRQQSRDSYLAMRTDEYLNQQQQQQHFEPCCQELKKFDEQCQCEALEQILQQQQQQGELRGQKLQKVAQQLQNLPQRCQSASRSCQIRGSGSWF